MKILRFKEKIERIFEILFNSKFYLLIFLILVSQENATPLDSLSVRTEILKQEYCLDKNPLLVPDTKTDKLQQIHMVSTNLDIRINLSLKNISRYPIIIQKDYFRISRLFVAKNLDLINSSRFIIDNRLLLELQFNTIDDVYPPSNKFVILQPEQSFTKEVEVSLDLGEKKSNLRDGNYLLGLILETWGGQIWGGKKAEQQWKNLGNLWFSPLKIEPISFTIKKPKVIKECME